MIAKDIEFALMEHAKVKVDVQLKSSAPLMRLLMKRENTDAPTILNVVV